MGAIKLEAVHLETLVLNLDDARRAESIANLNRIAAEEALLNALNFQKTEGSETHRVGSWAVTLTAKINHVIDWDEWRTIALDIPQHLHPVRTKPELDQKGLRWLKENEPDLWHRIAKCITSRPAKVAVTIKHKEQPNGN